MGRSSIPDIQFKRDDREEVRLEKLRRLAEAVQSLARQIDTPVTSAPSTPGTTIEMTGPGVLGRLTGTGIALTLTGAQVNTTLPVFSTANKGLVPSPGDATGFRFLRDDGSFSPITLPPGAIQHGSLAGLSNNDHPQYVLRSILTTIGDIFVRGIGDVERLPAGTVGQLLTITAGLIPAWRQLIFSGIAVLDFGAFPGASDASVTVTGQAGILTTSNVRVWLRPATTVDHTVDEHMVADIRLVAANLVAGTGFTIYGFNANQINEPSGAGTRISGQWTVAWEWM